MVALVQTVSGTQVATNVGSITASLTPSAGNLMIAVFTQNRGTGPVAFTGGDVTWTELINSTAALSNPDERAFMFGATATAATAVSVDGSYTLSTGSGGRSIVFVHEVSGHSGFGSVIATGTIASSTLRSVTIVTTAASAAILTSHHGATLEGNEPTTFTGLGSAVLGAPVVAMNNAVNTAIGVAGTYVVEWGADPGTSIALRRILAVVIVPAATVTFNYSNLEHRVMRGAGRAVMRGVA